jgi:hypothetical protein
VIAGLAGLFDGGSARRRPRLLVFVDLVQDFEVLAPVLVALSDSKAFDLRVVVSRWLKAANPAVEAFLRSRGLVFVYRRRRDVIAGVKPRLRGIDAVLTASESSHPAHVAGHALALRAQAAGVAAYTLQHGLENVGLIGAGAAAWEFASGTVFCWFPPELAGDAPEHTRPKLAHVGRPATAARPPGRAGFAVGVFENLHAERYVEADRARFVEGLRALAASGAPILLRPHPAGRWSAALDLSEYGNVEIDVDGDAAGALASVARVVTTPSTVVLDAAQAGLPVALAAEGGDLYRPFPVLRSAQDWLAFASDGGGQEEARRAFVSRMVQPGDAAAAVVETLRRDLTRGLASKRQVW